MKNFIIPAPGPVDPTALSEYLITSMQAFTDLTGIPVTYFDRNQNMVREFGRARKPCHRFGQYDVPGSLCRQTLASAAMLTSRLGEPYIFLCQAGLTNIAVSLLDKGQIYGCFIAGPIAMGGIRKSMLRRFRDLNDFTDLSDDSCRDMLSDIPTYPPRQISQLALTFYNSVLAAVADGQDYQKLRRQNTNLSDINDTIREYKKGHMEIAYPYEMESILIDHVRSGELEAVEENLKQLLHTFSVLEMGDLEGIRTKVLWLFAMILRTAAERGREINTTPDDNLDIINCLSEASDFEALSATSISLIRQICRNMISHVYKGNSQIITGALRYIHQNYQHKLSLQDVSSALHVNSSYFSALFRQEISMTFTDYLNQLRIGQACHLLMDTEMTIVEVANAVGFDDQSYFTRVFRKYKGITPHAYRKSTM